MESSSSPPTGVGHYSQPELGINADLGQAFFRPRVGYPSNCSRGSSDWSRVSVGLGDSCRSTILLVLSSGSLIQSSGGRNPWFGSDLHRRSFAVDLASGGAIIQRAFAGTKRAPWKLLKGSHLGVSTRRPSDVGKVTKMGW